MYSSKNKLTKNKLFKRTLIDIHTFGTMDTSQLGCGEEQESEFKC